MSAEPLHSRTARPSCTVTAVYDPDGRGADFAYTVGLCDKGLPELHVYARPGLGEDPGADWKLSARDSRALLDELAPMLVRGEITVGSRLTREYDGGLTRLELRVDPPDDRERLQAYGIAPGASVLQVRWSLHRMPEGAATELPPAALERARLAYDQLHSTVDPHRSGPNGWRLPSTPSFGADQRFGPLTPLVLAQAAQFWQAGPEIWERFFRTADEVDRHVSVTVPATQARAVGRPLGRTEALTRLESSTHDLWEWQWRSPVFRRLWRATVVEADAAGATPDGCTIRCLGRTMRERFRAAVLSMLSVQAMSDVGERDTWLHGLGVWSSVTSPDGAPGADWHAAPDVLDKARCLLGPVAPARLFLLAELCRLSCTAHLADLGIPFDPEPFVRNAGVRNHLRALSLTSAATCPPIEDLMRGRRGWTGGYRSPLDGDPAWSRACLVDWLDCLTAVFVHRDRLDPETVRHFASAASTTVPGIERALLQVD